MRGELFFMLKGVRWYSSKSLLQEAPRLHRALQSAIDCESSKALVRLTPYMMLFAGQDCVSGSPQMKSAIYLRRELPRRIARRVKDLQNLPFIALTNSYIFEVYRLYVGAFEKLHNAPAIESHEDEQAFCQIVSQLLNDHRDVVYLLAKGFKEVSTYIPYSVMADFLDSTLSSRLGIRLLADHYISLHKPVPDHIGIICRYFRPKLVVEGAADFSKQLCQRNYGRAPEVLIDGHVESAFPYITGPLEYILRELLKNSMRATVVHHYKEPVLPPVVVTFCSNSQHFFFRVSDVGGGIPDNAMPEVLKYAYSNNEKEPSSSPCDTFTIMCGDENPETGGSPLFGFGFGLPTSRLFASILGGSLDLVPMPPYGLDCYLKLRHINQEDGGFVI